MRWKQQARTTAVGSSQFQANVSLLHNTAWCLADTRHLLARYVAGDLMSSGLRCRVVDLKEGAGVNGPKGGLRSGGSRDRREGQRVIIVGRRVLDLELYK